MNFAVTRLDLGQTRLGIGWVLYEDEHNIFQETKPRDVKRLIRANEVMGLKLSEDGETIMVDTDFVKDLASKTGVGNYRYVLHGFNPSFMKEIMIVVAKHDSDLGTFYEIVTPFYQRFIVSESRMKAFMNSGDDIIGGVYQDDNGDIVLKQGVKHYFIAKPASGSDQDINEAKIMLNDGFNDLFEDSGELAEVNNSIFASDDELAEILGVSKEEMGEILNDENPDSSGENDDSDEDSDSDEDLPFGSGQAEEAEGQDEQTEPEMHDESLEYAEMLAQREEEVTEDAENGGETIEPGEPNAIEELIKEGQIDVTGETSEADDQTEQSETQTEGNGDEPVKKSKGKRRSKKSDKAEEQ